METDVTGFILFCATMDTAREKCVLVNSEERDNKIKAVKTVRISDTGFV